MYQDIVKNIKADPEGAVGKKIAKAWRELIDEQFIGMSQDLAVGTILWQEMARQKTELTEHAHAPSVQDQIKKLHVPLFFNPEALSWIEKALNAE